MNQKLLVLLSIDSMMLLSSTSCEVQIFITFASILREWCTLHSGKSNNVNHQSQSGIVYSNIPSSTYSTPARITKKNTARASSGICCLLWSPLHIPESHRRSQIPDPPVGCSRFIYQKFFLQERNRWFFVSFGVLFTRFSLRSWLFEEITTISY